MNLDFKNKQGQLLLELMIAVAIFALTVFYFIMTLKNVLLKKSEYRHEITASYYAQQGIEVAYNLSINKDWDDFYTLAYEESQFASNPYHTELNYSDPDPVRLDAGLKEFENKYEQKIFLREVGDMVEAESRVNWMEKGKIQEISYSSYFVQLNDPDD